MGWPKKKKRVNRVIIIYLVLIKIGTNWRLSLSFQFSDSDQLSKAPEPVEAAVQCPHSSTTRHDVKKKLKITASQLPVPLEHWTEVASMNAHCIHCPWRKRRHAIVGCFTNAKTSWCPLENEACNSTRPVWTLRLLQKRPQSKILGSPCCYMLQSRNTICRLSLKPKRYCCRFKRENFSANTVAWECVQQVHHKVTSNTIHN